MCRKLGGKESIPMKKVRLRILTEVLSNQKRQWYHLNSKTLIPLKYPPGKKLTMRMKDLASFCFPGGVEASLLERTPSLSELNELVYGQIHLGRDDLSFIFSLKSTAAASRLAIATLPPAYVLSRGIGWQGIGVLLGGLYGTGTGSTVSVENVGLLGLTRVGSRRVVQISAGFMIFFSMLGKFGALFASIPFPIFTALYCILFGLVASVGISFLQFTNMNSMRNLIITGLSLFLGLSIPQFFNDYWSPPHHGLVHTNAGWFNALINTIFTSPATVALIVAVFLDNTIGVEKSKKDRGMTRWAKFRKFKGDSRNEEFYNLPFNLNRFFPPT